MEQTGLGSSRSGVRPAGAQPHLLTAEEVAAYHRDGYMVPRFRFSPAEVSRLQGLLMQLVENNPEHADFLMQNPHSTEGGVQGLKSPDGWMEFATHPQLLDVIEQIMGPDIILRGSIAFFKRPKAGPATAWHRDAQLQAIRPLESTHVWISVTDSRIENACLRVIPGSHKARVSGRHIREHKEANKFNSDGTVGSRLAPEEFDESKSVDLQLEAGQMIVHDMFTIHGSRPNLGTRERGAFALRFMPATSFYDHLGMPAAISSNGFGHHTRPLTLVRGVDRADNNFDIGHAKKSN